MLVIQFFDGAQIRGCARNSPMFRRQRSERPADDTVNRKGHRASCRSLKRPLGGHRASDGCIASLVSGFHFSTVVRLPPRSSSSSSPPLYLTPPSVLFRRARFLSSWAHATLRPGTMPPALRGDNNMAVSLDTPD